MRSACPAARLIGEVHAQAAGGHRIARRNAGGLGRPRPSVRRAAGGGFHAGRGAGRDRNLGNGHHAHAEPVLKDELRQAGMTVQAHVVPDTHAVWGGNVAGEMLEWYRRQLAGTDGERAREATSIGTR